MARSILRAVLARFRTPESLLLLAMGVGAILAGGRAVQLGFGWTAALAASFALFAWMPLAARLQDRLLELWLASGRPERALKLAAAIRDSARTPLQRSLAEFDLGLVHLARGAPADAQRSFGRIERHRLQARTRLLAELHLALAQLRALPADAQERRDAATALEAAADAALADLGESPGVLAFKAEALLARGQHEAARTLLTRSLELDPDPSDPSPGERHLLFARAALGSDRPEAARKSLRIAAGLRRGPFVTAAREQLARLEPHD